LKEHQVEFIIGPGINDGSTVTQKNGLKATASGKKINVLIIKMTNFPYEIGLMAMFIFIVLYLIMNTII
tara:strand:+ start:877 stop:1083 length:207 start_codon:yes stop_codon:yes gene_type:complete